MRVVITGGAGLVGRAVTSRIRDRGDEVLALVRRVDQAAHITGPRTELVADDLSDVGRLTDFLRGADGVIHAAGSYRIGIRPSERAAMWDINVGTTTRVLDAALAAGTPRMVYVSTANIYGDTYGATVDESYVRDPAAGFLSWYDEAKFAAHEVAVDRIGRGAPVVIGLPSQVYGPGDRSGFGEQLQRAHAGKLPYRALDDLRIGLVHADDLATGLVAALDRGRLGESYNLAGPPTSLGEAIAIAARLGGHSVPAIHIPTRLLRVTAPLGRLIGQPNLDEVIRAAAGVTYLISSAKAESELGFTPRAIEPGLREVLGGARSTRAD
ncbi:MAG: NAD-dependent epimerase/dehydratase family protein [Candidatus Limnocylindrales bacterium]